jgi:hypothetical protein
MPVILREKIHHEATKNTKKSKKKAKDAERERKKAEQSPSSSSAHKRESILKFDRAAKRYARSRQRTVLPPSVVRSYVFRFALLRDLRGFVVDF